jgi:hypothetical protein
VGFSEVVQSVMKCTYAPEKMTLCITLMEFGTNFWSMKSPLLCTTVHCCGVSEACLFSSPYSFISFCMVQCLSVSISVRFHLSFWYVIVPVCGWTILLWIFSIGILINLIKYMRLSENIWILTIVHHNLEVQTYIKEHYSLLTTWSRVLLEKLTSLHS